ncbi:DgyrCDS13625 [Dimorphilus gyrociliatus]|nr:DgyrCDS13625 [Dimorphilus gyrociliatus]
MTNMVFTPNQTQSICPEDPSMANVNCTVDSDCPKGAPVINGNGVRTGTCNVETKTCNIYAWCPVEKDVLPLPNDSILKDSKRFTVLIKNQIEFIKFGVKRRNVIDIINDKNYLRNCTYSSTSEIDRFCPIFELGTIAKYAKVDYDEISIKGGVIAINIRWDCNLDYSEKQCRPEYSFRRLDNKDVNIAKGLNFRFANYYTDNNRNSRDLVKAYGIRFLIKVTGRAGKFNIVPLFLNIGSGIGLLGIATILCDFLMVHCLRKGYYYYDRKYFIVEDVDKEFSESYQEQVTSSQLQPQNEEEHVRSRVGEYNRFRD